MSHNNRVKFLVQRVLGSTLRKSIRFLFHYDNEQNGET